MKHTRIVRPMGNVRPKVRDFAHAMERKLAANDRKGGWQNDGLHALLARLREEVDELETAITGGAPAEAVIAEAADVANFAMMIADVVRR